MDQLSKGDILEAKHSGNQPRRFCRVTGFWAEHGLCFAARLDNASAVIVGPNWASSYVRISESELPEAVA